MKHVIIILFGLLFFVSCGKTQKGNTPHKEVKKTKVTVSKKEKTTKKKSTVVFMESLNLRTKIRSNLNLRQLNRGTVLILTIKRSIRTKNSIFRMAYYLKSLMRERMPQVDFLSL